ncbi:hypothetical protein [Persephonella sp.]
MVVDKLITKLTLRPSDRGLYFLFAEKADKNESLHFRYEEAKDFMSIETFIKAIRRLENTGLIGKEYRYFRLKDGTTARINKFHIHIYDPLEIPDRILKKTKDLNLKEKGILYTLYLLKSEDGYIFSTVKDLAVLFDTSYPTLSLYIRVLEEFGFIRREKFRLKVKLD